MVCESVMMVDEYQSKKFNYEDHSVFIDMGAHIGTWTMLMASINPTFKVYSYEPIPENFELLKKNIEQNGLQAYPFNLAISMDSIGKEKVYYNSEDTEFSRYHKFIGNPGGHGQIIEVDKISVDDIFKKNNIKRCRVVKADCEGCETKGFSTASPETLQKIDYIVGEFHPGNRTEFFKLFEPYFVDISEPVYTESRKFELQQFLFKNKRLV